MYLTGTLKWVTEVTKFVLLLKEAVALSSSPWYRHEEVAHFCWTQELAA